MRKDLEPAVRNVVEIQSHIPAGARYSASAVGIIIRKVDVERVGIFMIEVERYMAEILSNT